VAHQYACRLLTPLLCSCVQPPPQPRVLTAEEKAAAAAADARAAAATAQLPEEVQDVLQLHTGFLEEMGTRPPSGPILARATSTQ
jgi:hypothetical protein